MPRKYVDRKTGKPMIAASFRERPDFESKFTQCSGLLGGDGDNDTIRKAIEFVIEHHARKEKHEPTATATMDHNIGPLGLNEILYIPQNESRFLDAMERAKTVTLIGTLFGWLSKPDLIPKSLRTRIRQGKPSLLLTPAPGRTTYHTTQARDIFLREIVTTACEKLWSKVRSGKDATLFEAIGVNADLQYAALITDTEAWVRHDLSATPIHPLFWIYQKTEDHSHPYWWFERDAIALYRRGGIDLVQQYQPALNAHSRPLRPKRKKKASARS